MEGLLRLSRREFEPHRVLQCKPVIWVVHVASSYKFFVFNIFHSRLGAAEAPKHSLVGGVGGGQNGFTPVLIWHWETTSEALYVG